MTAFNGISGKLTNLGNACFVNGTPNQLNKTGAANTQEVKTFQMTTSKETAGTVKREDLDYGSYGFLGVNVPKSVEETKEIAAATNNTLKGLNCNYKVSSQQVERVAEDLNNKCLPDLNTAMQNAQKNYIEYGIKNQITPALEQNMALNGRSVA